MTVFCVSLTEDELQALLNLVKTSSVSGTPGMRLLVGLEDKLRDAYTRPSWAPPPALPEQPPAARDGGSPPLPPVDPAV